MDPNACLLKIRELTEDIMANGVNEDKALELAQAIEDLDNWLIVGGFLPIDWDHRTK